MKDNPKIIGKIRNVYFISIISVFLVLLIIGIIGILLINLKSISDYVKENLCFSLLIKEHVSEADARAYQKELDTYNFIKSTDFISSEKAAELIQEELGENFIDVLGYNPLPITINAYINSSYGNPDSLEMIKNYLSNNSGLIGDISYQENLVNVIYNNYKKFSIILIFFCILFVIISFALLNNTIRLLIYSKRNVIRTMKLIGAKNSYIRRPFLISGFLQGLFGALLTIPALTFIAYFINYQIGDIFTINLILLLLLFAIILIIGIVFSLICTGISINKYLKHNLQNLVY